LEQELNEFLEKEKKALSSVDLNNPLYMADFVNNFFINIKKNKFLKDFPELKNVDFDTRFK